MKRPQILRGTSGIVITAVTVAALFVACVIGVDQYLRSGTAKCTTYAAQQLPKDVVKTVEKNQDRAKIGVADAGNALGTVLDSRMVTKDWKAIAFASFEPRYCGYTGNINDFPATDAAARGLANPPIGTFDHDTVNVIKNGKIDNVYDNNVCIGDRPPTVRRQSNGGILMTLYCDRSYDSTTWTQSNPVLKLK